MRLWYHEAYKPEAAFIKKFCCNWFNHKYHNALLSMCCMTDYTNKIVEIVVYQLTMNYNFCVIPHFN